jgi:hypothetical protein
MRNIKIKKETSKSTGRDYPLAPTPTPKDIGQNSYNKNFPIIKSENVERPNKQYEQKHPPVYVTNPKDPRIGYYNKEGSQFLLKESKVKKEDIKPMQSKSAKSITVTENEEQPKKSTPIAKESLTKKVNPDFRDSDYTEKHKSVVDALGNPKYKYYNKDKVISEKEYKKLKTK